MGFQINVSKVSQKGDVIYALNLLQNDKVLDEKTLTLKAVSQQEHHSNTFVSAIDGSVQYYSVFVGTWCRS